MYCFIIWLIKAVHNKILKILSITAKHSCFKLSVNIFKTLNFMKLPVQKMMCKNVMFCWPHLLERVPRWPCICKLFLEDYHILLHLHLVRLAPTRNAFRLIPLNRHSLKKFKLLKSPLLSIICSQHCPWNDIKK